MTKQQILITEIIKERQKQDLKWGATDPLNTPYNWAAYIGAYTNRSLIGFPDSPPVVRTSAFKSDMIKVAALALAAAEKL